MPDMYLRMRLAIIQALTPCVCCVQASPDTFEVQVENRDAFGAGDVSKSHWPQTQRGSSRKWWVLFWGP